MSKPVTRRTKRTKRDADVEPVAKTNARTLEAQDPEAAGAVLADLAANPELKASEVAKKLGVSTGVVEGFLRRCRTRNLRLKEELYKIGNKDLQGLVDDRAFRLMSYLDDDLMMQGNLRDITYAFDVIMKNRQLLRGEPTAILSVEDRKTMNNLVPLLMQEAKRRGLVMDGEYEIVNGGA